MDTHHETPAHPLTEGRAWDIYSDAYPVDAIRAAFDAGREHERANSDDRPWEPLAPGDPLHAGDEVWRWWCGVSTRGIFDVQHPDSQVYTAERGHLGHRAIGTWCVRRRIPAPTPPAGEVDLPDEHPAHITDVETDGGHVCAYMALDNSGDWCGVSTTGLFLDRRPQDLAAFTLPDGTRARRAGDHEDGTPRFVKVREGEK